MNTEQLIRTSVEKVQNNIKIVRGPLFRFDENNAIIECDAIGAVMISKNYHKLRFEKGWFEEVCDLLNVSELWLKSFWLGWDTGNKRLIEIHGKGGTITYSVDEASLLGIKLSKEYVK